MARTVAVRGSKRLDRVDAFGSKCCRQHTFDILFRKCLDARDADAGSAEQIVDMPVPNVVLTSGDPTMPVDTRQPAWAERAAGIGIQTGFKRADAERADFDFAWLCAVDDQ